MVWDLNLQPPKSQMFATRATPRAHMYKVTLSQDLFPLYQIVLSMSFVFKIATKLKHKETIIFQNWSGEKEKKSYVLSHRSLSIKTSTD